MARLRTIKQTILLIKEQDPETCLSEWYLRKLVKSGKLMCHRAGNRYLVGIESLENYLKNPPSTEVAKQPYGIVRKIIP